MPSRSTKDTSSATTTCMTPLLLKSQGTSFSEQREVFLQPSEKKHECCKSEAKGGCGTRPRCPLQYDAAPCCCVRHPTVPSCLHLSGRCAPSPAQQPPVSMGFTAPSQSSCWKRPDRGLTRPGQDVPLGPCRDLSLGEDPRWCWASSPTGERKYCSRG